VTASSSLTVKSDMKQRYGILKRPWGVFYAKDKLTGKQESLGTRSKQEALRLLHAKNEALVQPMINRQIARAYLSATDPAAALRDWQFVMDEVLKTVKGPTKDRWLTAIKDKAYAAIKALPLAETRAEHFLKALHEGTVATNVFLRRLHNFALDMNWLLGPVIPKRQWPEVRYKEKRAITADEHRRIVERETNPERRLFYELCWHLGGSQSDMASLRAEDVDWKHRLLSYRRQKSGELCQIHVGIEVEKILRQLPSSGPLFPYLLNVRACDRGTEFKQRCQGLGIEGVTLHCYRYAWAERAKACGFPERFAQQALGQSSKAVHRAYAANADVRIPSLEDYEQRQSDTNVVALDFQNTVIGDEPVPTNQR
jgi:integrase